MLEGSSFRALLRVVLIVLLTLVLLPMQVFLHFCRLPLRAKIPKLWHRCTARIIGLELQRVGNVHKQPPTLFVANHSSYLDIVVLGAVLKCSFIAKQEIASWPIFGFLGKLQNTVFIERKARNAEAQRNMMASLLAERRNLVLFPEGTCGNGTRILPFKSTLFGIAEALNEHASIMIQPISLSYTRIDGVPIGRTLRPLVAWFGDMELLNHAWQLMRLGRITVRIEYHAPVPLNNYASRKLLSSYCEQKITNGVYESYRRQLA
jgi:lyso-ornithine lipid O-acyltransferase